MHTNAILENINCMLKDIELLHACMHVVEAILQS